MSGQMLRAIVLKLKQKRDQLGMTLEALAKRSGLSKATLNRLFAGNPKVQWNHIESTAEALGVDLTSRDAQPAAEMVTKQAKLQARKLVKVVQGTMGLEAQAVDQRAARRMLTATYKKVLQGPRRKLW